MFALLSSPYTKHDIYTCWPCAKNHTSRNTMQNFRYIQTNCPITIMIHLWKYRNIGSITILIPCPNPIPISSDTAINHLHNSSFFPKQLTLTTPNDDTVVVKKKHCKEKHRIHNDIRKPKTLSSAEKCKHTHSYGSTPTAKKHYHVREQTC